MIVIFINLHLDISENEDKDIQFLNIPFNIA